MAQGSQLRMRVWIESPDAVEQGTAPDERRSGEAGHRRPKEEKDTDRRQTSRWASHKSLAVWPGFLRHYRHLAIPQSFQNHWPKLRHATRAKSQNHLSRSCLGNQRSYCIAE